MAGRDETLRLAKQRRTTLSPEHFNRFLMPRTAHGAGFA